MYATDFCYDGKYLSDYNFIICSFDSTSGFDTVSAGSEITFDKVKNNRGRIHRLINTQYDSCIATTFHICKDPCIYDSPVITNDEYRDLMRWLNRKDFLNFQPFDSGRNERKEIHFNASFNVNKIMMNGETYGLSLTMETDKPFGYGSVCSCNLNIKTEDVGKTKIFRDMSDEIGSICPKTVITCRANGDLTLKNTDQACETVIKNCKNGEVITLEGETQIITSSLPLSSHDIASDFNYDFFRIGNSYHNRENKITVSLPCEIKISYYPVIKDIP